MFIKNSLRVAILDKHKDLTTKTVMGNANLSIDETKHDCGTKRYFEMIVTPDLADLLMQRNYISNSGSIKNISNQEQIIDKKIKLRSPLYCIAEKGICPTCYGNLYKSLAAKNIGILAGGAINVVGINTMMKMRHKASSVSINEVDFPKIIKKSGADIEELHKHFIIEKQVIKAKTNCTIYIDETEYDDTSLMDCGDKFQVPGIITVEFGETPDLFNITLPITIPVDLMKPNDYESSHHIITMKYEPGEIIMKSEYFNDVFDERLLSRILEGGAKYITNPEVLAMVVHDKLPGIDMAHIETIVSNMFRDADDVTKPARLTNYKKVVVMGQKKLPYAISWLNALAFENINRAIKVGLLDQKDAILDPIEKVVIERYGE